MELTGSNLKRRDALSASISFLQKTLIGHAWVMCLPLDQLLWPRKWGILNEYSGSQVHPCGMGLWISWLIDSKESHGIEEGEFSAIRNARQKSGPCPLQYRIYSDSFMRFMYIKSWLFLLPAINFVPNVKALGSCLSQSLLPWHSIISFLYCSVTNLSSAFPGTANTLQSLSKPSKVSYICF